MVQFYSQFLIGCFSYNVCITSWYCIDSFDQSFMGCQKYYVFLMIARIMTQSKSIAIPYYYKSTRDALFTIYRTEGWKALYKGLGPSLIGVSHVVVQFPTYEKIKSILFSIDVLIRKTTRKYRIKHFDCFFNIKNDCFHSYLSS
jgi:hypothetical protein